MDIKLKKELGQNFLTDRNFALKIIDAADLSMNDVAVEVGPGAGVLTQYLANEVGRLIAVEYDERFVHMLKNRFEEEKHVKIIGKDILTLDIKRVLIGVKNYKVIGSLPYNISKRIIQKFLESDFPPASITVLIQKEVALDYCAKVPKASFLSNFIQIFGRAEYIETVPKEVFKPEPKVDGGIMNLRLDKNRFAIHKRNQMKKFLKNGFMNPRKKLVKNLASIYKLQKRSLGDILNRFGLDENVRAGNLTFEQWESLFEQIILDK
ncbi:MAG: 16S rRNA (adenine(1518)-N(6)/adenine(1519)-N(6))-dimethyltransferase RsmA [Candidatus Dojkabacteria bacterium]|nr:16S rRNA (adenine(1518)-N(6)/adenine(1519)-N(6))-dimethyltransferase RsmA [Candidatus Dojkabacteria bacterium]